MGAVSGGLAGLDDGEEVIDFGFGRRAAVGAGGEPGEDVRDVFGGEAVGSIDGLLGFRGPFVDERALHFHFVNADVRHFSVFEDDASCLENAEVLALVFGPVIFVLAGNSSKGVPAVGHAIRKGEPRSLSLVEEDGHGVPLGLAIMDGDFVELRFDGLRVMKDTVGEATGNDAEPEGCSLVEIEDLGVVGVVAVDGVSEDFDFVDSVVGDAVAEVVDVGVAAFVSVGVGDFVDAEVFEVVDGFVGELEFGSLLEVAVEVVAFAFRFFARAECFFDELVSCEQVLVEEVAGGDQEIADSIVMMVELVSGEVGGGIERGEVEVEEIGDGVEVFASVEAAEDGLAVG